MVRKIINDYLDRSDKDLKENANNGYSVSGFKHHVVSKILKEDALRDAVSGHFHTSGAIHIHDLGGSMYSAYCCGHDLRELLVQGLGIDIGCTSKPPRHFQSACDLIFNYMQILSNEWEGAQAFSDVDVLLAPYIYEDIKNGIIRNFNDIKQCVQSVIFGLNYESRQGFQSPFTNFTLRLKVPEKMKNEPCLYAGVSQDYTYEGMQEYMDMFNRAYFEVMYEGDGFGRPLTFPIPTVTCDSEYVFVEDDEVTEIFWKVVQKFGSPYFSNYLGAAGDADDVKSMCCRLRLDVDEVRRATGIWDLGVKTGSLGVCTINLNRPACEITYSGTPVEGKDKMKLYNELVMNLGRECSKQLLQRKDYIYKAFHGYGLMPYSKKYVGRLETFFLTLGVVGAWEAYMNLLTPDERKEISYTIFCKEIMKTMHILVEENKEHGEWKLWNIEQTPAEGAAYRLATADRKNYPDCYLSGDASGWYLTNSTHYPVASPVSLRKELEHTAKIDPLYTGGTLKNIYVNERGSIASIKKLIHNIVKNTPIPYVAFTPIFGVCSSCETTQYGSSCVCEKCGGETEVHTRVVGYIRPVPKFNPGQSNQCRARVYKVSMEE